MRGVLLRGIIIDRVCSMGGVCVAQACWRRVADLPFLWIVRGSWQGCRFGLLKRDTEVSPSVHVVAAESLSVGI